MYESQYRLNELKIEVTYACLLQCIHCSSHAAPSNISQMNWNDCKRILSEAASLGVRKVDISGGEPLLWANLPQAIAFASANGMFVSLYSTGNAPHAISFFKKLKAAGLSRVVFSLFANTKDKHEKVTLVDGSFNKTLVSVLQCVSLGLQVEFHFVPMSTNYDDLRGVAKVAQKFGVDRVNILRLVPQGRAAKLANLHLKDNECRALRQSLLELITEGHDIRVGSPFNILLVREYPECRAGIDRLTISPELNIFPCDAFKQISPTMIEASDKYFSLAEYSLSDCWEKSPYLQQIRGHLASPFAEECDKCNMLRKCRSGCLAQKFYAYGGLVKQRDPMCLRVTPGQHIDAEEFYHRPLYSHGVGLGALPPQRIN